jgi:hypothetical protein
MGHAAVRLYVAILLAILLSLAGVLLGLWWAPFPVGVALGAIARRARITIPAGAASGLLAWTVPLLVSNVRYGLGPTAQSIAAIMGFGHQAAIPLALSIVLGTLLGAAGAWLGSAGRGVALNARVDATRNGW